MTRFGQDSCDLQSSVGTTAAVVAAARAMASQQPQPIINDPWAAPLVEAAGIKPLTRMVELGPPLADDTLAPEKRLQPMIDSFAVRTRFFDEFFANATASGIRQVVILGAGLDARAYRLWWPQDTVIYEVDVPNVLSFKAGVFSRLGVKPSVDHRRVPCDLRDGWAKALCDRGFDRSQPTAWSAEGVLMYLPPDVQDRLFDAITDLSAMGSRLSTEYHADISCEKGRLMTIDARWKANGIDIDTAALIYGGDRTAVRSYLTAKRWSVVEQTRMSLFKAYGLPTPQRDPRLHNAVAVTAHLD